MQRRAGPHSDHRTHGRTGSECRSTATGKAVERSTDQRCHRDRQPRTAIAVWQESAPDREFVRFCNKIDERVREGCGCGTPMSQRSAPHGTPRDPPAAGIVMTLIFWPFGIFLSIGIFLSFGETMERGMLALDWSCATEHPSACNDI